jgi:hypothetical protein
VITALALVAGSSVIFFDPIFQGMAISLASGVLVSTVLTLIVIPLGCIDAAESLCQVAGRKCEKVRSRRPSGGEGNTGGGGGTPLLLRGWQASVGAVFWVVNFFQALAALMRSRRAQSNSEVVAASTAEPAASPPVRQERAQSPDHEQAAAVTGESAAVQADDQQLPVADDAEMPVDNAEPQAVPEAAAVDTGIEGERSTATVSSETTEQAVENLAPEASEPETPEVSEASPPVSPATGTVRTAKGRDKVRNKLAEPSKTATKPRSPRQSKSPEQTRARPAAKKAGIGKGGKRTQSAKPPVRGRAADSKGNRRGIRLKSLDE